jgi:hypothetical protein
VPAKWTSVVGALSFLIPLGAVGVVALRRADRRKPNIHALVALIGVAIPILYTGLLWTLARYTPLNLFYGPRYPCLTAHVWAAGLVGAAAWAWSGRGGGRHWGGAWLMMSPFILFGLVGQAIEARIEPRLGIQNWLRAMGPSISHEDPLYVMPSELIPYYREELAGWRVRPAEDLVGRPDRETRVTILDLNPTSFTTSERDLALLAGLESSAHTELNRPRYFIGVPLYQLFHVEGLAAAPVPGLASRPIPAAETAVVVLHPRDLKMRNGWGGLEVDKRLWARRPALRARVTAHLGHLLLRGRYAVHVAVERDQSSMTALVVSIANQRCTIQPASGDGHCELQLDDPQSDPVLTLDALGTPAVSRPDDTGLWYCRGVWIAPVSASANPIIMKAA